jgi:hypothetical protein
MSMGIKPLGFAIAPFLGLMATFPAIAFKVRLMTLFT